MYLLRQLGPSVGPVSRSGPVGRAGNRNLYFHFLAGEYAQQPTRRQHDRL
jgi:hypothetical protein